MPPPSGSSYTANFAGSAKSFSVPYEDRVRVVVSIRRKQSSGGTWAAVVNEKVQTVTLRSTGQFKNWDFTGNAQYDYDSGYVYEYKLWVQGKETSNTTEWANLGTYPLAAGWAPLGLATVTLP